MGVSQFRIRSSVVVLLLGCFAGLAWPSPAVSAGTTYLIDKSHGAIEPLADPPPVVTAYYMYGTTASALETNAYNHGCAFARNQPGGDRALMLDFGAARTIGSDSYGALDFSGTVFGNTTILAALESASDGVHDCYSGRGFTEITYGNSNWEMTQAGMNSTDSHEAGYWQATRANNLYNYEQNHGRVQQDGEAGVDMEPSFDKRPISNELVNGASEANVVVDFDYGSADGCPSSGSSGSCNNGWGVNDVAWASFSGVALSLPEIYYAVNASQWTVVRRNWDANHSTNYQFSGVTGSTGVGLTPQEGWNDLAADNQNLVLSQPGIICFGC